MRNWDAECERWHQTAWKKLRQTGRCPFRLRIYSPPGVVDWVSLDGLTDEGRARLKAMNIAFRTTKPEAVLLCSDSWQAGPAFFEHYGIDELPAEEKRDRYWEILSEQYKGSLANVPDSLKSEGVFTIVKGPGFMQVSRFTFYRRELTANGGEKIIPAKPIVPNMEHGYFVSELIPDWWEAVVQ